MVSAVFLGERVEATMMRWERGSRVGEVRNSSMRRSQVANPRPLEEQRQMRSRIERIDAEGCEVSYELEPVTRTNRWLELPVQGGKPILSAPRVPIAPVSTQFV